MRWLVLLLVVAGLLWASLQSLLSLLAAPTAIGEDVTSCGQELNFVLIFGLTGGVVILALTSLILWRARRLGAGVVVLGVEALLAVGWLAWKRCSRLGG
jgi:hypothetical protein